MRTTREILRLKWACHRSDRQVAQSCGVERSTVADCLRRATAGGLTWPLPPDFDDAALEARLFPRRTGPLPIDPCRSGRRSTRNSAGRA